MKKCPYCQEYIQDDAIKCRFCGSSLTPPSPIPPVYGNNFEQEYYLRNNAFDSDPRSGKSRGITALLAIFLGGFGIQYFYLGKTTAGILSILITIVTCGLWEIVSLIQGILMLLMDNRSFLQKYVDTTSTFPLF